MKKITSSGLILLFLFQIIISIYSAFISTQPVYAAESGDGVKELTRWQTASGSINPATVPADRFLFESPKQVTDRVTGEKYFTSAGDSELFAGGSEEVLARGWFWYWPQDKALKKKADGRCYGAVAVLVHGGAGSGNGNRAVNVNLVQPTERADGDSCTMPGVGNGGSNAVGKGGDPEDQYQYDITSRMSEGSKVLLVTPLKWSTATTIVVSNTDRVLNKAGDGYAEKIRAYINDDGEARKKTYAAANYDYFFDNRCLNDSDDLDAFIAVSRDGTNRSAVFHRRGGDLNLEWDGQQLRCLFGRNIVQGPRGLLGGDTKSAIIGVYGFAEIGSETPATATNEEEELAPGDCDFESIVPTGWNVVNPVAWGKELFQSALDWFGCAVIKGALNFANTLNNSIDGYLATGEEQYQDDTVRLAWGRFLNVANILFVIGFLLMIISTALGFGFFDAYTVKKFLPRIIVAALLANISLAVVQLVIELTNALGGAVQGFILGPINTDDLMGAAASTSAEGAIGAIVAGGVGVGLTALATGGIFALVPAALAFLLAMIAAWAVITIRRVIILLLIVTAPFAIALWAIPGLEGWTKRWWKLLIQMLLVYPIIKGMIAAGMFTATIVYGVSKGDDGSINTMDGLTVLGAILLPFILLPTVFKMASSTLGNITGMINNKGKGVFDRLSNKARDRAKTTARAQKKHTNAELRQQSRQYKGHHKAIDGVTTKRTGRFAGARNAWNTRGVGDQVLNAARAKQSQEELQQAVYASKANAGGIDAKRRDGAGKNFRVTYTDSAGNKRTSWVGKDAAVAYGWKGAVVEAMKEEYDAAGNFKGYGSEVEGTLFDGSEAAQRAAGQIAGSQSLTPVIDAVRNGSTKDWEEFNQAGRRVGMVNMSSYSDDYSAALRRGDTAAATHAETANVVRTEVKDGFAQQLSSKMPSFVKGNALAFQGVTAETLSNFHENEVERMMDYVTTELPAAGKVVEAQETWSRIGQSVKQIVENPEQHTIGPKSLAALKERYDAHIASGAAVPNPELDRYMNAVRADGTLDRATTPKRSL